MLSPDNESRISPEVEPTKPTCVVLGSFRFNRQINEVIGQLEAGGILVLAPKRGRVVKEEFGFKILDTDEGQDPVEIWRNFLEQISRADAVYIVNPGGYVGKTVSYEMGMANGYGVPVYLMESLDRSLDRGHPTWEMLVATLKVLSPPQFITMVKSGELDTEGYFWYKPNRTPVELEMVEAEHGPWGKRIKRVNELW